MTTSDSDDDGFIPKSEEMYYIFCLECHSEMVVSGLVTLDRLADHRSQVCRDGCDGDVRHVVTTDVELDIPCSRCGDKRGAGHEIGSSSYCLSCAAEIWENIGGVTHE